MKKKVLFILLICLTLSTLCFGADAFTTKIANFINTTVLQWTRIIGALVIISGVIGWAANRHDQDKMSAMLKVIIGGAAIFGIGEIVGFLFGTFRSDTIIELGTIIKQVSLLA